MQGCRLLIFTCTGIHCRTICLRYLATVAISSIGTFVGFIFAKRPKRGAFLRSSTHKESIDDSASRALTHPGTTPLLP